MKTLASIALAALLPLLAACGDRNDAASAPGSTANAEPSTAIGRAAKKGIDQAREKIRTGNITISDGFAVRGPNVRIGDDERRSDGRPKAELTPQGELLIEGRKVAANPAQQALLKQYRGQIEQVAFTGMEIGVQGADLAGKAMSEAFAGIFGGDPDRIERRVEAEAGKIKVSARRLCDQLPAMYDTQQALAASLPEFRPYATMERKDIDDCYRDEDGDSGATRHQVRDRIREEIRSGIRETVQTATRGADFARDEAQSDAAAEAEAASAEDAAKN